MFRLVLHDGVLFLRTWHDGDRCIWTESPKYISTSIQLIHASSAPCLLNYWSFFSGLYNQLFPYFHLAQHLLLTPVFYNNFTSQTHPHIHTNIHTHRFTPSNQNASSPLPHTSHTPP